MSSRSIFLNVFKIKRRLPQPIRTSSNLPKSEEQFTQKSDVGLRAQEQIKSENSSNAPIRHTSALSDFDKSVLVFSGRFKTKDEIPDVVSSETLAKARSKARIRASNYLMILTIIGCLGFAYSGKLAAGRGESITKMNIDWHQEMKEAVEAGKKNV